MKIKKLLKKLKDSIAPPCPKCPYTLGYVKFVKNPCPECKLNGYQTYKILINKGGNVPSLE